MQHFITPQTQQYLLCGRQWFEMPVSTRTYKTHLWHMKKLCNCATVDCPLCERATLVNCCQGCYSSLTNLSTLCHSGYSPEETKSRAFGKERPTPGLCSGLCLYKGLSMVLKQERRVKVTLETDPKDGDEMNQLWSSEHLPYGSA